MNSTGDELSDIGETSCATSTVRGVCVRGWMCGWVGVFGGVRVSFESS